MLLKRRTSPGPVTLPPSVVQFPAVTPPAVQTSGEADPGITEVLSLNPYTMDYLLHRAADIQEKCHDFSSVKGSDLIFQPDGCLSFQGETYPMSRYSLSQLGTKIGVPAQYVQKCIDSGRNALAADNVNSWLKPYKGDLFLREYDGHIRGVLSSRYAVLDAPDVLSVVSDAVDASEYSVKGSFLNEERMHVRLASERMLQIEGEDLFPGLFLDTSDVGRSVLIVQFGIWKQVCTNGLIVSYGGGVLFKQKHIGITSQELYDGLVASLSNVETLIANAKEWVLAAKSKKAWGYNIETSMDEKQTAEFIQRVRNVTALTEEPAKEVLNLMRTKYDGSQFGLVNSITEIAQKYTLERRIDLETVAGRLLAA